jgi:NADPH:quinone reductase-like Zn-dependent oxidoreductase
LAPPEPAEAAGLGIRQHAAVKASRIHRFGPPDVVRLEETDRPVPGPGEVLVRVEAAGVGPWDAWVRAGRSVLPHPLPLTLGADLSGVVEEVGAGVEAFAPGDPVFGVTNAAFTGAHAEVAITEAGRLAPRPRRTGPVEAASVPVVAVTAWQMLFEQARVAPGQTVLVHGAAGNVGSYAVQLARRAGARVLATAGVRALDTVRALGAEGVFDYRASRFEERTGQVDAVIDTVGGQTQERSFAIVKPGGVLVSAVSEPDRGAAERRGVRASFLLVDVTRNRLERIAELIDAGELETCVGTVLPLAEARRAHEMLEGPGPQPRGRIVLRTGGGA